MKKLILTACAVTCAASVYAQGTVQFNNRAVGAVVTYVYSGPGNSSRVGNGTSDTPTGTTDWTGYTKVSGSGWMAAILAANGQGTAESSLTFGATPQVTTFRTGGAAGNVASYTATLSQVSPDAAHATLEIFVWDRASSGITDPAAALAAWKAGSTWAGGLSGAFDVAAVGGASNTPPALTGWQSFNVYAVPEPATMALAGLGAAALLIFRRRK